MGADGQWHFAPAYDLTFSYGPGGEHSTTLFGEGRSPNLAGLLKLGHQFGIKNADSIVEEVQTAVRNWDHFAEQAEVSTQSKALIRQTMLA